TVGAAIKNIVLVNAANGSIALSYNNIQSFAKMTTKQAATPGTLALPGNNGAVSRVPGAADLATYTAGNTTNQPGTFLCDETDMTCTDGADSDADSAHVNADGTYNMYWDWYGQDSLDGEGLQLISTVHFDVGFCNAFWDGVQMTYGDGCAGGSIVVDDVVGHELTHGVTEFHSGLVYAYEAGGINESFSDVWGEFYDLTDGTAEDTPANRWLIGEELGTFRDMQDPPSQGNPDKMTNPLFPLGEADNGGVHSSSGVNNKAAYLMVDGDTFNGVTVVGLGIDKVAQIYYNAQTTMVHPATEYIQLYDILPQSCTELIGQFGITAEDCESVTGAVTATEMNLNLRDPGATAAVCDTGDPITTLFTDDLESGSANWVTTTDAGLLWVLADTTQPISGLASNYGFGADVPAIASLETAAELAIPANAYLHFDHQYRFERGANAATQIYDGGVLQYSTDNGTTWNLFDEADITGMTYTGTLYNASPLAGERAFAGNSGFGPGSSRVDLADLASQNVRFAWTIASDEGTNSIGWWVDNVSVYTCAANATELIDNGGFEATDARATRASVLDPWVVKNAVGDKIKCDTETKIVAHSGVCAWRFKGSVGENTKLQQVVDLTGLTFASGDTLDLSAFINANKPTTSGKIKVVVAYSDTTAPDKFKDNFAQTAGYEEKVGSVNVSSSAVSKIKVMFINKSTSGKAYLDDVSLAQTSGGAVLPLPLGLPQSQIAPASSSSLSGNNQISR
ncbi:MAG TPA: M4 family metallopeptidase, partial [Phototrophicaceae bacterium]|nr:M4 family metallopeptidase [Phototrophicaceae bacterium]